MRKLTLTFNIFVVIVCDIFTGETNDAIPYSIFELTFTNVI